FLQQDIHLGQPAVTAEDIGITPVARKHGRSVRQVTEPGHTAETAAAGGIDDLYMPRVALDHQPEVAGAARRHAATAEQDHRQQNAWKPSVHQETPSSSVALSNPLPAGSKSLTSLASRRRPRPAIWFPAGLRAPCRAG